LALAFGRVFFAMDDLACAADLPGHSGAGKVLPEKPKIARFGGPPRIAIKPLTAIVRAIFVRIFTAVA
jgi:hypothetical protein